MHKLHQFLLDECNGVYNFGEVLSDLLYENSFSQSYFAEQIGYSDAVVSRLITKSQLPRWVNYQQLKKITQILKCNERQTGKLVAAFICTVMRTQGLHDEQL